MLVALAPLSCATGPPPEVFIFAAPPPPGCRRLCFHFLPPFAFDFSRPAPPPCAFCRQCRFRRAARDGQCFVLRQLIVVFTNISIYALSAPPPEFLPRATMADLPPMLPPGLAQITPALMPPRRRVAAGFIAGVTPVASVADFLPPGVLISPRRGRCRSCRISAAHAERRYLVFRRYASRLRLIFRQVASAAAAICHDFMPFVGCAIFRRNADSSAVYAAGCAAAIRLSRVGVMSRQFLAL